MKTEILRLLRQAEPGSYVSGQELCERLGVSRTAVWKSMKQLKEMGYEIEAVPNRGYCLLFVPDILSKSEIESCLSTKWVGHPIRYYHEIDSTNTEAKRAAEETRGTEGHGTVFVADMQTLGRGRRGRNWNSPHGTGIFFTILLKPEIEPANASMLTLVKALATAAGIREVTGLDAGIKWPNDIYVGNKKICGTLIENTLCGVNVSRSIAGIGLNINQGEFVSDAPNPVSMANLLGADTDISRVAARVGAHLEARLSLAATPEGREEMHREFKRRLWRGDGATHPFRRRDTGETFPGVITDVSPEGPITILDTASGSTSIFMFKEMEFLL